MLKGSAGLARLDGVANDEATMTRPPSLPEVVLLRLTAVRPARWLEPPAVRATRLDVFSLDVDVAVKVAVEAKASEELISVTFSSWTSDKIFFEKKRGLKYSYIYIYNK